MMTFTVAPSQLPRHNDMDKTEERGKRWEEYIGSYEFRSLDECQLSMHNFSPLINLETLNGYKPAKLQSYQNFNQCFFFVSFFLYKAYTCFQKRQGNFQPNVVSNGQNKERILR